MAPRWGSWPMELTVYAQDAQEHTHTHIRQSRPPTPPKYAVPHQEAPATTPCLRAC